VGTASVVDPGGGYSVRLPPGRHDVTLAFAGGAHSGGGGTGLLLAAAVAVLGVVAGLWAFARFRHR
jgi:hypothetical protein